MITNQADQWRTTNTRPMRTKNKRYINYGPLVINFLFQPADHFVGTVVTAYVDNVSVRSHHLHNDAVRRSFAEAVCALAGGADDELLQQIEDLVTVNI